MSARVQRWGNSLAIRIPRAYANDLGVREGSEVELPESLGVHGVVLADRVRCIDWCARHASLIARLPLELTDSVRGRLLRLLEEG